MTINFIAWIILGTLGVNLALKALADYLNIRTLQKDLPDEFSDVYDADRYRKSQEYLRVNTRFEWIVSIFDMTVFLIFWFAGGFPVLDTWVRSWSLSPVFTGLLYMGILLLAKAILSLPFSIVDTFVIEEKYGFNQTTWLTFGTDRLKGLLLAVVLGAPLLAGILSFFEYAGANAWWYCWVAVALFMLFVQFVAPTWIMPLFNKFTPIEEGDVKNAIIAYARSINFALKNIFVMDGSKRSSKANAYFTGFGSNKRIVLFDTLVEQHDTDELVAVLAHEMGHFKKRHILQMMLFGIGQMGVLFYLLSLFISQPALFEAFFMGDRISVYAGLIFFGMLFAPIDFFVGLAVQMISRKNEYEADRFAVETGGKAHALIAALKKLSARNLSNLTPHPLYVFLNYSHPPVLERIKRLRTIRKAVA